MQALAQFKHNEWGGTDSTTNWEGASHWGAQNWTIDTLDTFDGGLAHRIEDVVCAYMRGFIHVDACLSAIPIYEQQCAFPCVEQTSLAARCCWFQGRYKESKYAVAIEQVLILIVLCCVRCFCFYIWFQFQSLYICFIHDFYSLSQASAGLKFN